VKLIDIFNQLKEDRAKSFTQEDYDLPDFNDGTISAKIGTFDGYDIYGCRFSDKVDAYGIQEDGKTQAVVYINSFEQLFGGKKCQQIQKVWVNPSARGRGMTISILAFIIKKTQTRLISNFIVTDDGMKLYKKIISKKPFSIEILNRKNQSISNIIPDDLFSGENDYLIMMEASFISQDDLELQEGRLGHFRIFIDGYGKSEWD
jgi:hypothetical protein